MRKLKRYLAIDEADVIFGSGTTEKAARRDAKMWISMFMDVNDLRVVYAEVDAYYDKDIAGDTGFEIIAEK